MKRVSFTSKHMVFGVTRVTNQPANQPTTYYSVIVTYKHSSTYLM